MIRRRDQAIRRCRRAIVPRGALTSKNTERRRKEFITVRQACMACHVAENVGFPNDSATFKRTQAIPALAAK